MVTYVDNIRAGLTAIDPAGADTYAANAAAYKQNLRELDAWIAQQVATIPAARRLLVTNHESFGHFAERYGFTVVGTILPSAETEAAPSAQGLAELVRGHQGDRRAGHLPGDRQQPGSGRTSWPGRRASRWSPICTRTRWAPRRRRYLDMMHWNVDHIVEALK